MKCSHSLTKISSTFYPHIQNLKPSAWLGWPLAIFFPTFPPPRFLLRWRLFHFNLQMFSWEIIWLHTFCILWSKQQYKRSLLTHLLKHYKSMNPATQDSCIYKNALHFHSTTKVSWEIHSLGDQSYTAPTIPTQWQSFDNTFLHLTQCHAHPYWHHPPVLCFAMGKIHKLL